MKMTTTEADIMGPPPSKIPIKSDHLPQPSPSVPPPSSNPGPDAEPHSDPEQPPTSDSQPPHPTPALSSNAPYNIPPWSQPPTLPFFIEVLKGGAIVNQLDISKKGAYMFGRVDLCDFTLDHPTISRFHAVIQFKSSNAVYLYDLGSTHGTFVNKHEVKKMVYVELHVGDVLRFGRSTRLYILQGPTELMPPEAQFRDISNRQIQEEISDREASLQRARRQAALADGISWGIGEDAVEEAEDDSDEVTWQTYKGQLTEKQEKTREKVIKRLEKIAHMKKEIDAIRVKDIPQGGLTQGQQTQIARNELRISQIMEELENLEETLNESIRESLGARIGRKLAGRKRGEEVEEELLSDDDDFYDRTKKPAQKAVESQSVETADSLLDKREGIMKEIEENKKFISDGRSNLESEMKGETEAGDSLDAYMSGLSSRLVIDKTEHLEKKLAALESELNRVVYLLKIADPSGEASKKRELKLQEPKIIELETCFPNVVNQPPKGQKKHDESHKVKDQGTNTSVTLETNQNQKAECVTSVSTEIITTPYTAVKPQWLGAIDDTAPKEEKREVVVLNDSKEFVDYKDRDKVLGKTEHTKEVMSIENSAPGLILRKRKEVEVAEVSPSGCMEQSTSLSTGIQIKAEDAVALLLKHSKGYHEIEVSSNEDIPSTDSKRPKRVLGPEKPSFLEDETVYETWVPPEGQSGDGRTSLNDRFGY